MYIHTRKCKNDAVDVLPSPAVIIGPPVLELENKWLQLKFQVSEGCWRTHLIELATM